MQTKQSKSAAGLSTISERLQKVTDELKVIQQSLASGDIDPRVLMDFRDAVNRVRTTAWAVQQCLEDSREVPREKRVLVLLAEERVRVAYQMCRVIAGDASNGEISPRTPHLVQLFLAAKDLSETLGEMLGREDPTKA